MCIELRLLFTINQSVLATESRTKKGSRCCGHLHTRSVIWQMDLGGDIRRWKLVIRFPQTNKNYTRIERNQCHRIGSHRRRMTKCTGARSVRIFTMVLQYLKSSFSSRTHLFLDTIKSMHVSLCMNWWLTDQPITWLVVIQFSQSHTSITLGKRMYSSVIIFLFFCYIRFRFPA